MSDDRFLPVGLKGRLTHAMEECGEFVAAAGKAHRFGFFSSNPLIENGEMNYQWVQREMGDVRQALSRLQTKKMEEGLWDSSR